MAEHAPHCWTNGDFIVNTDPALLDIDLIHAWLSASSYWVPGIPRDVVRHAIEHSLNFGLFAERGKRHIGFARLITDYATFVYVCDVFVLEEFRGHELGVWLMECVAAHPDLQNMRRWMLGTKDAHSLYEKTGFVRVASPDRWMEKANPDIYLESHR